MKLDRNKIKNRKKRNDGEPLCKQWVRVPLPITYKQLLETKNLQNHVIHKPANRNELAKSYKTLKQMQETTLVYLLFDGIRPP